jgi:hypothetical protein
MGAENHDPPERFGLNNHKISTKNLNAIAAWHTNREALVFENRFCSDVP